MISEQQEDDAEGTDGFRRLGRRRISV